MKPQNLALTEGISVDTQPAPTAKLTVRGRGLPEPFALHLGGDFFRDRVDRLVKRVTASHPRGGLGYEE